MSSLNPYAGLMSVLVEKVLLLSLGRDSVVGGKAGVGCVMGGITSESWVSKDSV